MIRNMGDFSACLGKIAGEGKFTDEEAKQILQELENRLQRKRAKPGEANPMNAAVQEMTDELKVEKNRQKILALRDAAIRAQQVEAVGQKGGIGAAKLTLQSMLHGTSKGDKYNIWSQWQGQSEVWNGQLTRDIEKLNLTKVMQKGLIDRDVVKGLFEIMGGAKADISKQARGAAEALMSMFNTVRPRLNEVGASIRDSVQYMLNMDHDPYRMREAAGNAATYDDAAKAWWDFTRPLLKAETFDRVVAKEGQSLADAITAFGREIYDRKVAPQLTENKFGVNLAKKVSRKDELLWRDADAWSTYREKFGRSETLMEGMFNYLHESARDLALMSRLGLNARENFNQIVEAIAQKYIDHPEAVRKFQEAIPGLQNVLNQLDGSANHPVMNFWANLGRNLRTIEGLSYLGAVGPTHLASLMMTVPSEAVHHGMGRFESLVNVVKRFRLSAAPADQQELDVQLGTFERGLVRDMFSRWNADESIPGKMSNIANHFMKWTGLHWLFDNATRAVKEVYANHLARMLGKDFSMLDKDHQLILSKYGIDSKVWDLLRTLQPRRYAGYSYLTPDLAFKLSDDLVKNHLGLTEGGPDDQADILAFKQNIADRLIQYYHDVAANSIVTAGPRERALVVGSTKPGTLHGELMRFISQFKMWPIAAAYTILGREFYISQNSRRAAWNLGMLLGMSALGGYIRMSIVNLTQGKGLPNPSAENLLEALARGGGLGIYGDYLFGAISQHTSSLRNYATDFIGPVGSDANELLDLWSKFKTDLLNPKPKKQFTDFWSELAHFSAAHVPYANLFYFKGMADYLLWYHLYEAINPGWWDRANRQLIRDKKGAMAGYTPGSQIPWVPPLATFVGGR